MTRMEMLRKAYELSEEFASSHSFEQAIKRYGKITADEANTEISLYRAILEMVQKGILFGDNALDAIWRATLRAQISTAEHDNLVQWVIAKEMGLE